MLVDNVSMMPKNALNIKGVRKRDNNNESQARSVEKHNFGSTKLKCDKGLIKYFYSISCLKNVFSFKIHYT